jgi:hypothetical protein
MDVSGGRIGPPNAACACIPKGRGLRPCVAPKVVAAKLAAPPVAAARRAAPAVAAEARLSPTPSTG